MTTKPTATEAFLAKIAEASELLELITAGVDDHLGVDPERLTWSNVADAERLVAKLREVSIY